MKKILGCIKYIKDDGWIKFLKYFLINKFPLHFMLRMIMWEYGNDKGEIWMSTGKKGNRFQVHIIKDF
jgi:hypothetical protein